MPSAVGSGGLPWGVPTAANGREGSPGGASPGARQGSRWSGAPRAAGRGEHGPGEGSGAIGAGGWIGVPDPLSLAQLAGRVVVLDFCSAGVRQLPPVLDDLAEVQAPLARGGRGHRRALPQVPPREPPPLGAACGRPPRGGPSGARRPRDGHLAAVRGAGLADGPSWSTQDGNVVGAMSGEGNRPLLLQTVEDTIGREGAAAHLGSRRRGPSTSCLRGSPPAASPPGQGGLRTEPGGSRSPTPGHNRVLVVDLRCRPYAAAGWGRHASLHIVMLKGAAQPPGRAPLRPGAVHLRHRQRSAGPHRPGRHGPAPDEEPRRTGPASSGCGSAPTTLLATDLASPWDVDRRPRPFPGGGGGRSNRLWRVPAGRHGRRGSSWAPATRAWSDGPAAGRRAGPALRVTRVPNGVAFVDAESSALRILGDSGRVPTLVGNRHLRLGPPRRGPAAGPACSTPRGSPPRSTAGSFYLVDTYNSRLCGLAAQAAPHVRVDPATPDRGGLFEPGGLDVLADGRLVVADTGHNRVVVDRPGQRPASSRWSSRPPACRPCFCAGRRRGAAGRRSRVSRSRSPSPWTSTPIELDPRPRRARCGSWSTPSRAGCWTTGPGWWRHVEPTGRLRAAGRLGRRGLAGRDRDRGRPGRRRQDRAPGHGRATASSCGCDPSTLRTSARGAGTQRGPEVMVRP